VKHERARQAADEQLTVPARKAIKPVYIRLFVEFVEKQ
jgi:hypothetical protein